jgi:hydroxymethylglutaryl-CoA reductase
MIRIGTRLPFEYQTRCLVDQKVQDGQIDIELLGVFILHPPGQDMQALARLAVTGVQAGQGGLEFLLQVSHGRVVKGSSGQHEDEKRRSAAGQDKKREGLSRRYGSVDAAM